MEHSSPWCASCRAKVAAAEQKDGFFAIVTNIPDMSAAALVRQYKQVWRIEDTFGEFTVRFDSLN